MGMQGPLTAQALGRSPFDEVVEGAGNANPREPTQQYDHGGRPINPETVRINRDIIRSHNQVMLVIGVAEAENPNSGSEADSQRRHDAYEESIGLRLVSTAKICIEAVGIFGINGLRDRILIYKQYSKIPFWDLYQQSRQDFSITRDILPGAPTSFLSNYTEVWVSRLWLGEKDKLWARRCVHEAWSYIRVHLELHIALQRLGLIPYNQWLPNPSFFIPFTNESPIMAPAPLENLDLSSALRWIGGLFISSTPFVLWVLTQRMLRDWKPQIWRYIFNNLPSTALKVKTVPPAPPSTSQSLMNESPSDAHSIQEEPAVIASTDSQFASDMGGVEAVRRPSIFSSRGDDYGSDDDENDGVRATLISFDVEATESTNAAPGLWSAELRPSVVPNDSRSSMNALPTYFDTPLTQLPTSIASQIFTNSITRILMTPYEAMALRLAAKAFCLRFGLPMGHIHDVSLLSGLNWTCTINYLGTELLHLVLTGEVWAVFTCLSQWFHLSEEEWKLEEGRD